MATGMTVPDIAAWPRIDGVPDRQRLFDWAIDVSGSRSRLCLLRGAGNGKSRLLAWFLAGSASAGHPYTTVHATIPAQGLTTDTFAWELGRQLGYGPLSPDRLLNRIAIDQRSLLLIIPDLHRAGRGPADLPQADPATLATELVRPLLALPHIRAAVEVAESGLLADQNAETITVTPTGGHRRTTEEPAGFADLIAAVPRTVTGRPDWSQAPAAVRDRILDQALHEAAGRPTEQVQRLLSDPGFLVYGPARATTAAVADERIPLPNGGRTIWRRAAPQLTATSHDHTERAALLHAAALGTNAHLAEYLHPLAEQNPWTAVWSRHDSPVAALCALPGDGNLLLAADPLGRLATCDTATGTRAALIFSPPRLRPRGIAPRDSRSFLLLDESGTLHHHAPPGDDTACAVLTHITEHHGSAALAAPEFTPTALGGSPHTGHAVIGDSQGAVHLWSLHAHQATPHSFRLHRQEVVATTCLHLPGSGLTLVFSAALDGSVRLWEISHDPMPTPIDQRPALVTALASTDTAAGPLLAVAWNDSELHLWHVLSGKVRVVPLLYPCDSLAFTPEGLLTIGGPDGLYTLRIDLDGFETPAP